MAARRHDRARGRRATPGPVGRPLTDRPTPVAWAARQADLSSGHSPGPSSPEPPAGAPKMSARLSLPVACPAPPVRRCTLKEVRRLLAPGSSRPVALQARRTRLTPGFLTSPPTRRARHRSLDAGPTSRCTPDTWSRFPSHAGHSSVGRATCVQGRSSSLRCGRSTLRCGRGVRPLLSPRPAGEGNATGQPKGTPT